MSGVDALRDKAIKRYLDFTFAGVTVPICRYVEPENEAGGAA